MSTLTLDPGQADASSSSAPSQKSSPARSCCSKTALPTPEGPSSIGVEAQPLHLDRTTDLEPVAVSAGGVAAAAFPRAVLAMPRWLKAAWRDAGFPVFAIAAVLATLSIAAPSQALATIGFSANALIGILPFFVISIFLAASVKATGAEVLITHAFVGRERRMIVMAALLGALSPFCSCGVIPVVTSLLMAGVPIAPVMAFWISSPLMDPNMFLLTAGGLGLEFAVVKTLAAVGMGLFAGFITAGITRSTNLDYALREQIQPRCGCAGPKTQVQPDRPVWAFWRDPQRTQAFVVAFASNGWFLGRWLIFAFVLESLMVAYIPSGVITRWLGGDSVSAVLIAVGIGIPAYLNGYAAIPLVAGLIELGMNPAVGLGFMLGGGVTSIPAALAVWAVAKPKLFGLYLALASAGSLIAAYGYMFYLAIR